jgi:hypothetical protein
VQIPDPSVRSQFFAVFGRPERLTACACERSSDVTLVHTLHLLGSDETGRKISAADGRLTALMKLKKTDAELMDELSLVAWGRLLRESERAAFLPHLQRGARSAGFEDFMWALLNTKEFVFNH